MTVTVTVTVTMTVTMTVSMTVTVAVSKPFKVYLSSETTSATGATASDKSLHHHSRPLHDFMQESSKKVDVTVQVLRGKGVAFL